MVQVKMLKTLIFLSSLVFFVRGEESPVFGSIGTCCDQGLEWGKKLDDSCDNFPVPVKDVIPEMQPLCISAMEVCCTKKRRELYCQQGQQAALAGQECSHSNTTSRVGLETYKDCCLSCTLGIIVASMAERCTGVANSFGHPWEDPFLDCCRQFLIPPEFVEMEGNSTTPEETPGEEEVVEESSPAAVQCPEGFEYNRDMNVCDDINECESAVEVCSSGETCLNNIGSFLCEPSPTGEDCEPGFMFFLISCIDINECTDTADPCSEDLVCVNTEGSYECQTQEVFQAKTECPAGFRVGDGGGECEDVNECQTEEHNCLDTQRCDNTIGSFLCVRYMTCGTGYTLNYDSGQCEDNNECVLGTHNCHALGSKYFCRNIQGSFRCEKKRCSLGEILDENGECTRLSCGIGFEPGPLGYCMDVDECATGNACAAGEECVNTMGSYACVSTCEIGLRLNSVEGRCEDIDECTVGTAQCFHGASCVNTIGSYKCLCNAGYHVVNGVCTDIDECRANGRYVCGIDSECQNSEGSFRCICKQGFKHQGRNCVDVNECTEIQDICAHSCVNLWGSYRCQCNQGFKLASDSRTCLDVDECQDGARCMGLCVNEPGSYKCGCPPGYRLSSNRQTCDDIDECVESNPCRGGNQHCHNTRGGYKCADVTCPDGYLKEDGHANRCKRASMRCRSTDLACLRKPVSVSFNFMALINNLQISGNGIDLFTMQSAKYDGITAKFTLSLVNVHPVRGVLPATSDCFRLKTGIHQATLTLAKQIVGPQDIELNLLMEMYYRGRYSGSATARIFIFVGEYEY